MLTITRSHNSVAATDYFTNGLSSEGYYLDGDVKAVWSGKTAELLNLRGKTVEKNVFSNLVSNVNPNTQKRLTVRNAQNRRAGFDLTFSAVKSVSILYALTGDKDILRAHRNAIQKAMQAVEADAQTQANTDNERIYQNTGNIIYAAFDHFTSRPNEISVNGRTKFISDPQLHTHCFIPNATWNAEKKRFQAFEIGNIHRLASYYEAIYHSHLSKELQRLGFTVERNETRYEIAGVSRKLIEKFSNRTATIEQIAKEKNITDAKSKAKLGALTRNSKAKTISEHELLKHWKSRLSEKELSDIQLLKDKPQPQEKPITAKEAIDRAISHFEERQSAYQEKRVLAHALTLGYGRLLPHDVQHELNNRKNILRAEIDSVTYITTHEMVRAEERMIRLATQGKSSASPIHQTYKIKQEFLNDQQQNAVQKLLKSFDQVNILKGHAGVGKTSLLIEIDTAIKETGKKLIALAPSSQAVKQLSKKGFEADTIAGFLVNEKKQKELKNNTLLIDEAGMSGVKTMSKLLELAHKYQARVILSGDTAQHNSVEFGDALRILEEKAKLKTARVDKIMRQKPDDYKKAVELLAKGKTTKGYQALDKMGSIKEIPEHDKRIEAIAEDYIKSVKQKKTALIISPTHKEGDIINAAVRHKLKQQGIIKGKERELTTLKNLSFTDSQKQDTKLYNDNQVIRFINHQKGGYKAAKHYEVLPPKTKEPIQIKDVDTGEILPLPHQKLDNYHVYKKTKTKLAKGDSIRLTQNSKSIEGTKMNNGSVYKIEGFTRSGDLKLSNGKTISKDNAHYKHAYCETSYSSQGKDAQHVYISMSDLSFGGASKEQFYVSVSRGKEKATIYTSDQDALKTSIRKSNKRQTAQEVARKQEQQRREIERKRKLNEQSIVQNKYKSPKFIEPPTKIKH
ncbi:relaxase domain-containing protein [Kordia sp. TARA_039_SRF]|nr:relaxase domain-containing protein [Kordia sp. TARA_039_SRF]